MNRIRRVVVMAAASALVVPAAAGAAPAEQPLVRLLGDHAARSAPRTGARRIATVSGRRPLTHVRTVLPELRRTTGPDGRSWVHVALPGRPNGITGWIRTARTRSTSTAWRIRVDLSDRRVVVFQFGQVVRRLPAVVGAPATPTPRGHFFIEEALRLGPQSAGGPFALATSARSDVLQEFDGGPGQIALHGRHYLYEPLGTASSHGCIRLGTPAITWLAERIGAGVPLTIRR
jgi:lipoprotein-anchoring transpeptidase ErfK/SrfK